MANSKPATITIGDFLTDAEIKKVQKMYRTLPSHEFTHAVCEQVIKPQMARINKALGQENDALYLSYAVQYVMMQARP